MEIWYGTKQKLHYKHKNKNNPGARTKSGCTGTYEKKRCSMRYNEVQDFMQRDLEDYWGAMGKGGGLQKLLTTIQAPPRHVLKSKKKRDGEWARNFPMFFFSGHIHPKIRQRI